MPPVPRWFACVTWTTLSVLGLIPIFTAIAGLTHSLIAATIVAVVVVVLFGRRVWSMAVRATPASMPASVRRLFAVGALLLIGQLLLASAFILNPNLARWDGRPWTPQRSNHSCVSSYWIACEHIRSAPDIFAEEIYSIPQANPVAPRVPRPIGPLLIDQYEYPPAFLVLPRLIRVVAGDFWGFRRVWFALNLVAVVAGVVLIAARFDRALGTHALWLTPFVAVAPAIVITFVMGNVQLAIISVSMIAMVLFERKQHAAGGVLLAYALVSKLYPGLLVLYLLLRRDWRAVAWIALCSLAFVAISIADFGSGPYVAFATHMPKLMSGEAFPAFRNPVAIAVNESIPGLVFKLGLFGVPQMGFAAARAVGWAYTVIAVVLTARLALRPMATGREPLAWIAILILATMRSPFLPTYAPFPSMWAATLLAALTWDRRSGIFITAVAGWVVLAFTFGTGGAPPAVNAIWTFVHTVAAFVLVALVLRVTPASREHQAMAPPLALATAPLAD
jgi:alpha-1,2-mannosyltransferase